MKQSWYNSMEEWIAEKEETIVADLKTLLRFPTIYDPSTANEEMPYGQAVHDALQWLKGKGEEFGFDIKEGEGQYLVFSRPGKRPDAGRIDSVSHVDVVSVDDQWTYPPFAAEEVDGRIYARGAQDMKTSLWLSVVALQIIKELDIDHEREIRIVIGTDEETTMQDMAYYVEQEGLPDFMITPDGSFPVGNGEFGDITIRLVGDVDSAYIDSFQTYNSENMICDRVDVRLKKARQGEVLEALAESSVDYSFNDDVLSFLGVAAHSSKPEEGSNALASLFHFFAEEMGEAWAEPFDAAFSPIKGEGLGYETDYPMGFMTVNPSQGYWEDGRANIVVDIRFPNPLRGEDILANIQGRFPDFEVSKHFFHPVTEISLENPFVKGLLEVFDRWIQTSQGPYYSKGITYAKLFQGRGVVFGIDFEESGMENRVHARDEYFDRHLIPKVLKALTDALVTLANTEDD